MTVKVNNLNALTVKVYDFNLGRSGFSYLERKRPSKYEFRQGTTMGPHPAIRWRFSLGQSSAVRVTVI